MISDVLCEAVQDIDEYLNRKDSLYQDTLREVITDLRNKMEAVRIHLDVPLDLMNEEGAAKTQEHWKVTFSDALHKEVVAVQQRLYGQSGTTPIEDVLASLL